MPLIDGVEVFVDEKAARKLQKNINAIPELSQELKTDIDPNKINLSNEFNDGSNLNIFFDDTEYGSGKDLNDRKARYITYKEMDGMEFIHRGIEIISDDASQSNDAGDVMKFFSDDEAIKGVLEELFIKKLDMNNELWTIFYETVKMGDNFYEIIPDDYKKPKEIKRIRYLDPDKMERIEKDGKLSHFSYKVIKKEDNIEKKETQEYKLFPWQIIHFKIDNKSHAPYGGSLLEAGVRTYRRLVMLEDLMLVYRISRAPERRVFYIDVGNLNAVEAKRFLTKMKNAYRTQSFVDENGNINKKANVMSITSDIFVPVREGQTGTRIETLQGGQAMGATGSEDPLLTYFKNKILKTMNIPPSYMGEQQEMKGSLSTIDQKFGRFIERVQAQIVQGLNKIAALELFFKGYKKEDLNNFMIELTPPSNVKEITEIELINQRMSLIATIQQLNLFPNEWILKHIMKMSDKEISDITLQKKLEAGAAGAGGIVGAGAGGAELGGAELGGAELGGEIPPEAGVPAEAGAAPEELAASALVNMFGKDFLIENKEDFFNLVKSSKEYNRKTKLAPMLEAASDFILGSVKVKNNKVNRNNIVALSSLNEFKGLDFKNRKIHLWEKDNNGTLKDLNELIIECGNGALNG